MFYLIILAICSIATAQYHRIESPSTYLPVESCRDISDGIFGDPKGTCASVGYSVTCTSCHNTDFIFYVRNKGTCNQKLTKCHFKADNEKCTGSSQCPYTKFNKLKLNETSCDARSLISNHEGKRLCVYKDSRGIPTIGIGYNLENPGARQALKNVGADYDSILSGKTCLTDSQVMQLFEPSYQSAVSGAQRDVSSFSDLCCNVQEVMIDMTYNLGTIGFGSFRQFISLINQKKWASASSDGRNTAWCGQVGNRCSDDMNRVQKGC